MRRLVAVMVVALLSLSIVGCGGGETPPADTGTEAGTPPAAPAVTPGTAAVGIGNRSAISTETFEPFVVEDVPAEVQERLNTKQAMLLFFYNAAQLQTDDLRAEINTVIAANRGDVDLLVYDLSKYTSVDASGYVKVDSDSLQKDEKAKESVRFARAVGVDHLPYIIIVDDQGYKIFWARGFIDAELLGRQVMRASR